MTSIARWYRSLLPAGGTSSPAGLGVSALVLILTPLVAIAVSVLASAAGLPDVLVPASAAVVVAIAFVLRPADGLGAFLLFSLLAITTEAVFDVDLRYFDEIALVLLVALAILLRRVPNGRLRLGVPEVAILVLAGSGIISSLLGAVPADIWVLGFLLLFKGVVFFYLVAWMRLTLVEIERVGLVLVVVALVILGLGFAELLDPTAFHRTLGLPLYDETRGGIRVIKSVFTHPSLFGWFTAFASLILYGRFVVTRTVWVLPLALLLNVGTMLSGRRTPLLGVLIALSVGLIWHWRQSPGTRLVWRTWIPVAAAVTVLAIAFLPVWTGMISETLRDYGNSQAAVTEILKEDPDPEVVASVAQRTALYVASVAVARDHLPFGGGLGRFGSYMSRVHYSPLYEDYGLTQIYGLSRASRMALTDTFWPSVLGETGVIGLVAFGTFLAAILTRLWRVSRQVGTVGWQVLAVIALLIFVDRFIGSLTAMTYVAAPIAYFTFGTVGAALAVASTRDSSISRPHV